MLFFPTENDIFAFLQELLKWSNSFLPFIIINKQSHIIVGSTRYLNIDYDNHRMEIGHTWMAKSFRRTTYVEES
jgi:N-acetyltransferase